MTGHLLVRRWTLGSRPSAGRSPPALRDELGFTGTVVPTSRDARRVGDDRHARGSRRHWPLRRLDSRPGPRTRRTLIEPIVAAVANAVHDGRLSLARWKTLPAPLPPWPPRADLSRR